MNPHDAFLREVKTNVEGLRKDADVQALSRIWMREITPYRYAYNFSWMGRPIIQFPQDMIAMQEIVWAIRPDLIIETGVAHGGSVLYYSSLLEMIGHGSVIGIDIDIRQHNRDAIASHPMSKRLELIEGSSVDAAVVSRVHDLARGKRVVVVLDSNHTHDHVLQELRAYAPLVSRDSYCIVMDTLVELMPERFFDDSRPWRVGDNPHTAVQTYLREDPNFEIDRDLESKLLITVAPGGYLKRIR